MRSFGLWYKGNEENHEEPVFSVHINFWSESVKKGNMPPDLDVGIKIVNFRKVNEIVFHCPFVIEENNVKDLAPKLSEKRNANIIFNIDGEIATRDSYSIYTFEKNEKLERLLIFPMKQNVGDVFTLIEDDGKTDIIFDFSVFNTYIKQKKFDDLNEAYIRFRITTSVLQNSIYFDSEPTNKSFESAFSGTRIFDFKINEKRNLGDKTITKIEVNKYIFPKIDQIHLLVMEPSSYDVESFANPQMTCRELEGNLWDDYFESKINYTKGRILAYHWKFNEECSCLVKVKYSRTNISTLLAYIFIVIALGVIGSTIVAMIQALFEHESVKFALIAGGTGALLFLLGICLGKKK